MNTRPENIKNFHVSSERRDKSAFLDEQGHSRMLIDGKVQPVRYTHQAVTFPASQQTLNFDRLGEYVDMREENNRLRFPELLSDKDLSDLELNNAAQAKADAHFSHLIEYAKKV
jgi:hypothetical protein